MAIDFKKMQERFEQSRLFAKELVAKIDDNSILNVNGYSFKILEINPALTNIRTTPIDNISIKFVKAWHRYQWGDLLGYDKDFEITELYHFDSPYFKNGLTSKKAVKVPFQNYSIIGLWPNQLTLVDNNNYDVVFTYDYIEKE